MRREGLAGACRANADVDDEEPSDTAFSEKASFFISFSDGHAASVRLVIITGWIHVFLLFGMDGEGALGVWTVPPLGCEYLVFSSFFFFLFLSALAGLGILFSFSFFFSLRAYYGWVKEGVGGVATGGEC